MTTVADTRAGQSGVGRIPDLFQETGAMLARAGWVIPLMLQVVTVVMLPVATAWADHAFTSRPGRSSVSLLDLAFEATTGKIARRARLEGRRHG